jgi:hypothetical protein
LVFGIFIDVPLIVGTFALMLFYRRQLTDAITRIKLPLLALSVLLSVPLIIFEEQINCMTAWCGQVIIPPTLPFLVVEIGVLGVIVMKVHAKNLFRVILLYSIFGLAWEILLGGLVGASVLIDLLIGPYVALSYAFVSMLPIRVLIRGRLVQSSVGHDHSALSGPVPGYGSFPSKSSQG